MYTPADLGYYNRGMSLPHLLSNNVDISIRSVLFPAMSDHSNNPDKVKQMLRRAIRISSYFTFFLFTLLATSSKPIIILLLTEKWLPCIPYMQIFCISSMFLIVAGYNVQALKALGRGKEVVKLEVLKKPIFLIVILAVAKYGVFVIALTSPFNSLYAMLTNMRPTWKILSYSFREQLKDFMPATLMAIAIAIVTLPISFFNISQLVILSIQLTLGVAFFIGISKIFSVEGYVYVEDLAKTNFKKIWKK